MSASCLTNNPPRKPKPPRTSPIRAPISRPPPRTLPTPLKRPSRVIRPRTSSPTSRSRNGRRSPHGYTKVPDVASEPDGDAAGGALHRRERRRRAFQLLWDADHPDRVHDAVSGEPL